MPYQWGLLYLIAINVLAWALTVWDKRQARLFRRRVAESTLFTVAALGGAVTMYITMCRIRHKTKHRRFMWGLPLILLLQVIAAALLISR